MSCDHRWERSPNKLARYILNCERCGLVLDAGNAAEVILSQQSIIQKQQELINTQAQLLTIVRQEKEQAVKSLESLKAACTEED